ncbi:MAG: CoA-binding protein [Halothiobacillaceae bacterium]
MMQEAFRTLKTAKTFALLGASAEPGKYGHKVFETLKGRYRILPVNPKRTEIEGTPCYASYADLPERPDAVILTIKESLGLPMNLISHHLKLLKVAGLVRAERDPSDARWIYYEIDPQAMTALRDSLFAALDPARLRPRADHCGPPGCGPPAKPRKGTSTRRTP